LTENTSQLGVYHKKDAQIGKNHWGARAPAARDKRAATWVTSVYRQRLPSLRIVRRHNANIDQRPDAKKNVLSTFVFDAYGAELSGGATGEPWGFGAQAGYFTDNETGLIPVRTVTTIPTLEGG